MSRQKDILNEIKVILKWKKSLRLVRLRIQICYYAKICYFTDAEAFIKKLRSLMFKAPAVLLSWIGRQGTHAVAAIVVISIFVPSLGKFFKPHVTEAVFVLLCIAFLRMDTVILKAYLKRPAIIIVATVWTSLVVPFLFGVGCHVLNLRVQSPDIFTGIMLQAIASPMMATPAIAILMGFDATLILITMVLSTVIIPFTAPLFVYVFIGSTLALSPFALGVKLFIIIAGSAAVGMILRRILGLEIIRRQKERIDGFNIIILFVFVAAIMEGIAVRFLAMPKVAIGLTLIAVVIFVAIFCITALIFALIDRKNAYALGFMASQRNMGLMLAATAGALPDIVWLYFAISQFPIYLSPKIFQWALKRTLIKA